MGKRLSRLSESANQVLAIAAVVGREFRLDVLQRVAGLPEEELFKALEEASDRAVVEQRPSVGSVGFRFTHAFFRQTLYEEIFVPRRIRLHQQVGKALEEVYGKRLEEHAAELAEHFVQSTEAGDLQKALHYCELAAQRAMQVFAYSEAVRHLEQALKTQEVLDPDDSSQRCDLLLALGDALLPLGEPQRVAETVAEEAFAIAETLRSANRATRAALQALEAWHRAGPTQTGEGRNRQSSYQTWVARADQYAAERSVERIHADIYLCFARMATGSPAVAHVYLRKAAEQALESPDNGAFYAAAGPVLSNLLALRDRDLRARMAAEVQRRPREGARTRDLSTALRAGGGVLFNFGDRAAAEEQWRELEQLAERTQDSNAQLYAAVARVQVACIDGRLEAALTLLESLRERASSLGVGLFGGGGNLNLSPVVAARLNYLLGRPVEPFLAHLAGDARTVQAQRSVLLSWLGRTDEVQAIRARFGDIGSDEDESGSTILVSLLESAIGIGDDETSHALIRRLSPLADQLHIERGVSIGRLLGDGARLLGEPEQAREYYEQAQAVCERVRFRPEIALLYLALAELLLEQGSAEAQEHLDVAIEECKAMGMRPFLERALSHKGLLHA